MSQELTSKRADCCVFCKSNIDFELFYVGIVVVGVCKACLHLLVFDELKRRHWLPIQMGRGE